MSNSRNLNTRFMPAIFSPDPNKRLGHRIIEGLFSIFFTLSYTALALVNTVISLGGFQRSINNFIEQLPDINRYAEIAAGLVMSAFDGVYNAIASLFSSPADLVPLIQNISQNLSEPAAVVPGGPPNLASLFKREEGQVEPSLSSLLPLGISFFKQSIAPVLGRENDPQNNRVHAPL